MASVGRAHSKPRSAPFAPKPGRPTAHQSAAIARAIMDAATRTFLSEGFESASMETIAIRAGVPKSTLYKRFPDKRTLLRAVLNGQVSAWCLAERSRDLGDDLETRLKRLTADMLRRASSPEVRAFWGLVAKAWSSPEEAGSRQDVIGYTKMVDSLVREIKEYGPRSGIRAKYPRQVAKALMAMIAGWIEFVGPAADVPEKEAVRFAHSAVDLLLRGKAAW